MNIFKKDDLWLGLILGILGPVVGFLIFYLIKFLPLGQSIAAYLNLFKDNSFLIPKVISLSLLVNGVTFFLYTQYRKDETSRGILVATLIYAIIIIVFKLK
ncbi:MAG: hypothetical protein EPN39_06390 [Chitinophagaceae bacterium]|nr:MAG: hypothetical protein EPN39_06390 [Chitinophagaceae bacterium]